jgi:hypothetical protein
MLVAFVLLLVSGISGCTSYRPEMPLLAQADSIFTSAQQIGLLQGADMKEASGIVASINNPGMWWIINDSGYEPIVYLVDSTGQAQAHYRVDGVKNRDWEDLAMRTNPITGVPELLIAEIGDNRAVYPLKHIYVIDEPMFTTSNLRMAPSLVQPRTYSYVYPDGNRDAETLMVDPLTQSWVVVSKREENVRVYQFNSSYIEDADATYANASDTKYQYTQVDTLLYVHALSFGAAVAGDFSADGMEILIKNYNQVFYWKRESPSQSIVDVFKQETLPQPYEPEAQGESIAFTRYSRAGYVTVSEKSSASDQPFLFYKRIRE